VNLALRATPFLGPGSAPGFRPAAAIASLSR
jgi:hypothetical protein